MSYKIFRICLICVFLVIGFISSGQIEYPRISPPATLIQQIGLSTVKVEYARPSVRGRAIVGDLVPFDRIWRVGANESTKIHFSDSVKINGLDLAPGVYALYAIPQEHEWTIIIHNNITHWGDGRFSYKPEEDALRFAVKPKSLKYFVETLTIEFDEITHKGGLFFWEWERTRIEFQVVFNTRQKMLAEIDLKVSTNPTADTFYESARYLQEEGIQPQRAQKYLIRAQELAGDKYYIHRIWSLVEAQLGNYKDAIQHAELSKELASKEGKDEFVRMNEKSIAVWMTKR